LRQDRGNSESARTLAADDRLVAGDPCGPRRRRDRVVYWSAYVAGFVLFAGVILAIAAPVWFDAVAVAGGDPAAIGVIGAALALDRARSSAPETFMTCPSRAPRHPGGDRFRLRDARLAAQSGSYRHTTYRTHGSGPNAGDALRAGAAGAAIGSPARRCRPGYLGPPMNPTLRTPAPRGPWRRHRAPLRSHTLRAAAAAALRQHGLAAVPGAPVLITDDPAGVGAIYRCVVCGRSPRRSRWLAGSRAGAPGALFRRWSAGA
jgi:hypothetical protein